MALDSVAQQPAPIVGESAGAEVWPSIFTNVALPLPEWLVADMKARHEAGIAKYGTPLRVHNGRDPDVDAYQEALDLLAYSQQRRLRHHSQPASLKRPAELELRVALDLQFHMTLSLVLRIGTRLYARRSG
ncbi:MAG: hypothetical protein QM817_10425 [Archangium sp.]